MEADVGVWEEQVRRVVGLAECALAEGVLPADVAGVLKVWASAPDLTPAEFRAVVDAAGARLAARQRRVIRPLGRDGVAVEV